MQRIRVIDSHTGGEPTRLIVSGGPHLGSGPLSDQVGVFRNSFDHIRSAVINEPRGSDFLVGGLIVEPTDPDCVAGIIFFNNTGYIQMCGHGTIGLVVSLAHLGRLGPGEHRFNTPVGAVTATLNDLHTATIRNVPSYRYRSDVEVEVDGLGVVTGDVAWGGNWFFLTAHHRQRLDPSHWRELTDVTLRIRAALQRDGIKGFDDGLIDHIELFGPPSGSHADSRSFVLCPGGAYDRSPCGTGTSAKIACLAADGKLNPGQVWRQESIIGSIFQARYEPMENPQHPGMVSPLITGSAWVTGESEILLDETDPFCHGIHSHG